MPGCKMICLYFIWALLLALPALLFVAPWFIFLPWIAGCLWLVHRGKRAEVGLLISTLLFLFICTETGMRLLADQLFYREHERFARHGRYLANIHREVPIAHGDMVAMDPKAAALASPHRVQFQTDSDGFRNAADYAGEPYILLGDSFVAGVGHSAPDLLATQINQLRPGSVYSLGYPGEPKDYQRRAWEFLRTHPDSHAKFIWYIYEGNDLVKPGEKEEVITPPNAWERWAVHLSVRELPLLAPRYLTVLYKRIGALSKKSENSASPVVIKEVGGKKMAFYQPYIDALSQEALRLELAPSEDLLARTACVFIIPDKSRVYMPATTPPATVNAVKAFFAPYYIPVMDLGPVMQDAAKEAMKQGAFLYWPDDTHWNREGMAVAANEVQTCIK